MSHNKQKKVEVEITSLDKIKMPEEPVQADGWGEKATEVVVEGKITHIVVRRDGKSHIGLRIMDTGEIVITNYSGLPMMNLLPTHIHMELPPNSKWK